MLLFKKNAFTPWATNNFHIPQTHTSILQIQFKQKNLFRKFFSNSLAYNIPNMYEYYLQYNFSLTELQRLYDALDIGDFWDIGTADLYSLRPRTLAVSAR